MDGPNGYFGKVPMRGDFVSARISGQTRDILDEWLAEGLRASQEALGAAWLDRYMTAPIWHFAVAAGLCGPQPQIGVLIPSVDRVGRNFPLLALRPTHLAPVEAPWMAVCWHMAAEAALLAALEEETTLESFEAAIEALPAPSDRLAPIPIRLALRSMLSDALGVWWTEGSPDTPAQMLVSKALPDADLFPAFFGMTVPGAGLHRFDWSPAHWGVPGG